MTADQACNRPERLPVLGNAGRYRDAVRYAVIMAGGSGTRLWPLSRQGEPKQLLRLIGGKSLLRLAYERVAPVVGAGHVLVCTGAAYAGEVLAQLPEISPQNLLGEPVGRDSLNAVAWPVAVLAARDPQAVVAMVTADQLIEPVELFGQRLKTAFEVAEKDADALVTFGVVPDGPQTGFGYLHRGATVAGFDQVSEVIEFKEKPDAQTAQRYLGSGEYWWNSGMFVWQAATLLRQLQALKPATHEAVLRLAAHPDQLATIYPELEKTSVDFAVMEPVSRGQGSAHVVAVALDSRWADVGSFASLYTELPHDDSGNAVQGSVVADDTTGCLLINAEPDGSVLAVTGLRQMVVVRTSTATMACPMEASQQVKGLSLRVARDIDPALA